MLDVAGVGGKIYRRMPPFFIFHNAPRVLFNFIAVGVVANWRKSIADGYLVISTLFFC